MEVEVKKSNHTEFFAYAKEIYEFERYIYEEIILSSKLNEEDTEYQIVNLSDKQIYNTHDTTFRNILSNKREAYLFINNVLNLKDTKNEINIEDLQQCNDRYITKTYYNKEIDIIYKIKNRQVYFLIEHQSSVDYEMPKRIVEYTIEILRQSTDYKEVKNKRYKLPLIIPIVLYTGNKKWNVKGYIGEIQEEIPGYNKKEFGRYILIDANKYKDEELIEADGALSKIILLEKAKDIERTYGKIKYENLEEYEKELIDEYTCNVVARVLPDVKIEEIRKNFRKEEGGKSMLADALLKFRNQYIEKGEQEMLKKVAKRMLESNVDIKKIKSWTNLTEKEIEALKDEK